MQSHLAQFEQLKVDVVAICVDSVEQNEKVASGHGLEFPILSDPDLKAIDAFGLRHVGGGFGADIARPAVFIIDESGRILWRRLTDNWRVRTRPEELLAEVRALESEP